MYLCADMCNAAKHLELDRNRRFAEPPIVRQRLDFGPTAPTGDGGETSPNRRHSWEIDAGGQTYDGLDVAEGVVREWDRWLKDQGMS